MSSTEQKSAVNEKGETKNSAQSLSNKARNEAQKALIANHAEEYTKLLGDARAARGLPRDPGHSRVSNVVLKSRIADLEQLLIQHNIEVPA